MGPNPQDLLKGNLNNTHLGPDYRGNGQPWFENVNLPTCISCFTRGEWGGPGLEPPADRKPGKISPFCGGLPTRLPSESNPVHELSTQLNCCGYHLPRLPSGPNINRYWPYLPGESETTQSEHWLLKFPCSYIPHLIQVRGT